MRDNDAFHLIDPDEAVAIGCLLIGIAAVAFVGDEAPKEVPPVPQQARQCDLTIAQFGPGERWYGYPHVYECVAAARDVPRHILTYPLAEER